MSKDNNGIRGDAYRESGWQALANAIVAKAAEDYRNLLMGKNLTCNGSHYAASLSELEGFFNSEWFSMLTDIDGQGLMRNIRRLVG